MYGPGGKVIGAVEYHSDADLFTAATVPLTIGGKRVFHDYAEAVTWIRDQHAHV